MTLLSKSFPFLALIGLPLLLTQHAAGADSIADSSYIRHPLPTSYGILLAGEDEGSLILRTGETTRAVASGRGCGRYAAVSPDGKRVGFKRIESDGKQTPYLIDLKDGTPLPLSPPTDQAGEVSFTADGAIAFTQGPRLLVQRPSGTAIYDLGSYANLAPISPDGQRVVFNDPADQLWLLSLSTETRTKITAGKAGYFGPRWSPDGSAILYSSLGGDLFLYKIAGAVTVALGQGDDPTWSPDSRSIVFSRRVVKNYAFTSADLLVASADNGTVTRVTQSPDLFEAEPVFSPDGRSIIFRSYNRNEVYRADFQVQGPALGPTRVALRPTAPVFSLPAPDPPTPATSSASSLLDIPYINQVYDTPDWFNGHAACGPTSSIMVLAYYDILPRWDTWCSWPRPGHTSSWGRYICENYYFRGRGYATVADDPNGTPSAGGFGFMWANGSPHSMMETYYVYHGLWADLADSPPLSAALAEIAGGNPYTICVDLTTSGHIVVAHTAPAKVGTIYTNDPYGDKNRKTVDGYPNYFGKNALYDWPGYNNGFVSLSKVYWAVSTHGVPPAPPDTLVDDIQLGSGFYLHTAAPASMSRWRDLTRGYNGHLWYALTSDGPADTSYAVWTPNLPADGLYEIFAYISVSNATAARYIVAHAGGVDTVVANQKPMKDQWLSLGTFQCNAGASSSVRLGDVSDSAHQQLVFDAIRWSAKSTSAVIRLVDERTPESFGLSQNYPNPFNPVTTIRYVVAGSRENAAGSMETRLIVYDILGREVAILVNEKKAPGWHEVTFDASGLASGVYVYRLTAGQYLDCRNMVFMK